MIRPAKLVAWLGLAALGCAHPPASPASAPVDRAAAPAAARACFLLYELGVGRVVREPSEGCTIRVTPASTFKIPHALAALDAGVVTADEVFRYDGRPSPHASYRRDQTLASAVQSSVLWYFQTLAERLGPERERTYLAKFDYGNQDISGGLTTFWLYQSLAISPEEQERFLVRLFQDELPIDRKAQAILRKVLVQPTGLVVNATGQHPFAQPWPAGAVVAAKTGSAAGRDRPDVRWLVGQVRRDRRAWIFVSNVVGPGLPPLAAVDLAATSLKRAGVL
jgi:beta-lactamase class D